MSSRAAIVALCLALALGLAAAVSIWPGTPRPHAALPLLDADLARVERIVVTRPDGTSDAIVPGATPGSWEIDAGERGEPWPLDPARVQAMLRLLRESEVEPAAVGTVEGGPIVRVSERGGGVQEIRFAGAALGGRVGVRATGTGAAGTVPADLSRMLTEPGPRGWRDRSALPGLGPETARVTVDSGGRRVSLARVGGRWGLVEPIAAPAEARAVESLLVSLARVRVERFLDDGTPGGVPVAGAPVARVRIESDRRVPRGEGFARVTTRQELSLGAPADATEQTLMAMVASRVEEDGRVVRESAPRPVIVSRGGLDGIAASAEAYVSRRTFESSPGDVRAIVLEWAAAGSDARRVELTRTIDGWLAQGLAEHDGADAAAQATDVLALLCEEPCEDVTIGGRDAAGDGAATLTVTLLGLDRGALETCGVALAGEGAGGAARLTARAGAVTRAYRLSAGRPAAALLGGAVE